MARPNIIQFTFVLKNWIRFHSASDRRYCSFEHGIVIRFCFSVLTLEPALSIAFIEEALIFFVCVILSEEENPFNGGQNEILVVL